MIRRFALQTWFDEHDRWFENPFRALAAGFSLAEVSWMYSEVYKEEYVLVQFAEDLQRFLVEG